MRESPKILGCRIFPSRPATKIYFSREEVAVPKWLRSSSCYGGLLRSCERCDGLQCLALCREQVQRTGIFGGWRAHWRQRRDRQEMRRDGRFRTHAIADFIGVVPAGTGMARSAERAQSLVAACCDQE